MTDPKMAALEIDGSGGWIPKRWRPDYLILEHASTQKKRFVPRVRYRWRLMRPVFKRAADAVAYRDKVCRRAERIFGQDGADGSS